jgi:putative zinc finger protein
MTHETFEAQLGDYAEGILPVGLMRAFRTHLTSCSRCASLADAYTSALADLHSFPRLEVPEGFTLRVLENTTRRPAPLEAFWSWLGLPRFRLTPASAGALLSMLLLFLAGTSDGKRVAKEINMATYQTYSNALRLYYRSSDLKETAAAVGKQIPGRLEGSVDWIRQRLEKQPQNTPRPAQPDGTQSSRLNEEGSAAA